jgi:hypothetical protein
MRLTFCLIFSVGRPPWYDTAGQHIEPCVIGKLD